MKTTNTMDLTKYSFPNLTASERVFSVLPTDRHLLEEAKNRGFYCANTPYNKLFSKLFFEGGKLNFKPNLDPEFKEVATIYMKAFMQSWEPKHEEKEAICAMLMSELLEPTSL